VFSTSIHNNMGSFIIVAILFAWSRIICFTFSHIILVWYLIVTLFLMPQNKLKTQSIKIHHFSLLEKL
jgi:hypothetical protein